MFRDFFSYVGIRKQHACQHPVIPAKAGDSTSSAFSEFLGDRHPRKDGEFMAESAP